jgi:predicted RNA-binding protein YlxR (DUF448 family)
VPRRRCVGCGRVAPKSELLRIAAVADLAGAPARAVIDAPARLPGRGAYLCRAAPSRDERPQPADQCLAHACRRRSIERALRRAVAADSICAGAKLVESFSR